MKKAGIITIYQNNRNYGGLLQAYALQKVIQAFDFESEILNYTQNQASYRFSRMRNLGLKRTFEVAKNKLKTRMQFRKNPELGRNIAIRNQYLHDFEMNIPHTEPVHDDGIKAVASNYDVLVCGSDQIWNPGLWSPVMFLDIQGFEGRRFSYAASIGRNQLTEKEKAYISEHAKGLDAISVREKSAENLVQKLVQKKVETVLDPTFLLERKDWEKEAKKPEGVPEQFVFSFFLGENADVKKAVFDQFSTRLPIVTIPHLQTGYKAEDEKYSTVQLYDVGPREWIWLILNAEYIFTDSFHGTAFSVNLNRIFFSFPKGAKGDKQSINSRLLDLLTACGIEDRFISDPSMLNEQMQKTIDWGKVNNYLEQERTRAMTYLQRALND